MEATMTPTENEATVGDNSNQRPSIVDIIKFTPNLEEYILANIYTKCEKPDIVEHVRFSLYDGWNKGNIQRGRMCIFYGVPVEGAIWNDKKIVSYFLLIKEKEINIFLPENTGKGPDITIPFPTDG